MKADGVIKYGRQQSWKRYGKAEGTPPGSKSGACAQGGSSGTWENPLSPGEIIPEEKGYRLTKRPGAGRRLLPAGEPVKGQPNGRAMTRYRGASEERSDLRWASG